MHHVYVENVAVKYEPLSMRRTADTHAQRSKAACLVNGAVDAAAHSEFRLL